MTDRKPLTPDDLIIHGINANDTEVVPHPDLVGDVTEIRFEHSPDAAIPPTPPTTPPSTC
jgi:hypothetical protein